MRIIALIFLLLPSVINAQYNIHIVAFDTINDTVYCKSGTDSLFKRSGEDYTFLSKQKFKRFFPSSQIVGAQSGSGDMLAANNLSEVNPASARSNLGVNTQAETLLAAWPIGSVYISVGATNPGTLFGGTWVAFGAGRVLVGIDGGQSEFDVIEETGGAKTHTLTESEMPSHTHVQNPHNHSQRYHAATTGPLSGLATAPDASSNNVTNYNQTTADATAVNQSTGGGAAHNNLQPYIVVKFWKRTE